MHEPTLLETCTGDNPRWTQVACGVDHTVGLTEKGEVYTCGSNKNGQLGHGDKGARDTPTRVVSLDGVVVVEIACGNRYTAALTDKGEIFTWYVQ